MSREISKLKSVRRRFTEEEMEYLCRFYELDGADSIAYALDRHPLVVRNKVKQLKDDGKFVYYQNLRKYYE